MLCASKALTWPKYRSDAGGELKPVTSLIVSVVCSGKSAAASWNAQRT